MYSRADEPLRMSDLADRLGIVPRSATTVVDALESAGLATRATDPANHAAALHMVTMQGGVFGCVSESASVIESTIWEDAS